MPVNRGAQGLGPLQTVENMPVLTATLYNNEEDECLLRTFYPTRGGNTLQYRSVVLVVDLSTAVTGHRLTLVTFGPSVTAAGGPVGSFKSVLGCMRRQDILRISLAACYKETKQMVPAIHSGWRRYCKTRALVPSSETGSFWVINREDMRKLVVDLCLCMENEARQQVKRGEAEDVLLPFFGKPERRRQSVLISDGVNPPPSTSAWDTCSTCSSSFVPTKSRNALLIGRRRADLLWKVRRALMDEQLGISRGHNSEVETHAVLDASLMADFAVEDVTIGKISESLFYFWRIDWPQF
ncbi:hypothetical protein EDB92DRAFT_1982487 [Lactarius akahatsu]|uniref:Uncharacterized protein n=1 Tax=Lactarius akahatsu TaxID=416441 RepID=A0AAD4L811_9AGAM|nr:hypothetical protein EDB92DRAFT_1982487 [Lactarius akahatsu]